eukprot:jgi/Psemu1/290103/fgenesh1_pg.448_\
MNISALLLFVSTVLVGPPLLCARAEPRSKVAISGVFSLSDGLKLPAYFDAWKTTPPCSGDRTYAADLFLVFLDLPDKSSDSSDIVGAVNRVASIFKETNGWGRCIDKVIEINCDIESTFETYKPQEFYANSQWENEANDRFERTVRALQLSTEGPYDYMYLVGIDSVPSKPNWLDLFVDQIENGNHDFVTIKSTKLES